MSAKSVVTAFVGFLAHHATDLTNLSTALGDVVSSLPIDSQDKERVTSVIDEIRTSAENINAFLNNTTVTGDGGEVVVKESDLEQAVANYLASDAGKAAIAAATSTEGNASA